MSCAGRFPFFISIGIMFAAMLACGEAGETEPGPYSVTYEAGEGGSIEGEATQAVEHGDDGETVTAVPDAGHEFVEWSDGLEEAARTDTNVTEDITVTAHFSPEAVETHTLTYETGEGGSLHLGEEPPADPQSATIRIEQTVEHGEDGQPVIAVPDEGYEFAEWSDGLEEAVRTDTNVTEDITVTAQFDAKTYTVGGLLTGLIEGGTLVLRLNDEHDLVLDHTDNEHLYEFEQQLPHGAEYHVVIIEHPATQVCTVLRPEGTVDSVPVNDVDVECFGSTEVAMGGEHSLAIMPDGTLWAWGENDRGQLGLGDDEEKRGRHQVCDEPHWRNVFAGDDFSFAIREDGTLWAWGRNRRGQLGLGDPDEFDEQFVPAQVGSDEDWAWLAAGEEHVLALKEDGSLWSWGRNRRGQLGLGDPDVIDEQHTPARVGSDENWSAIAAGSVHSLALKDDGTLWAWGRNRDGQLGFGDPDFDEQHTPAQVGADDDWAVVAAREEHSLAIKNDGTLWAWGDNGDGQLGLGDDDERYEPEQVGADEDWVAVVAGDEHTLAIKQDGSLWAWGYNGDGQLGLGDDEDRYVPVRVGSDYDWVFVVAGEESTIAGKSDGSLWGWGENSDCQLGTEYCEYVPDIIPPLPEMSFTTVIPGGNFTLAFDLDGAYWAWGNNSRGQLGLGDIGPGTSRFEPEQADHGLDWEFLKAGRSQHVLALAADGTLWSWGDNTYGQLGLGDSRPATSRPWPEQIAEDEDWEHEDWEGDNWITIATGGRTSFAIDEDDVLWRWGGYESGQLGFGHSSHDSKAEYPQNNWEIKALDVAAGMFHTLVLAIDGTLIAAGGNISGQLGLGDNVNQDWFRDVGEDDDWVAIEAGHSFSLGLKADGTLWSWGANGSGQLGLGHTDNRNEPTQIGTDSDWDSMVAGQGFVFASKEDGSVWAWGANSYGQLGLGDNEDRHSPTLVPGAQDFVEISAGGWHVTALDEAGMLWAWGRNSDSQLGFRTAWFDTPTQLP